MVEEGAFSHKIDYVTVLQEIINFKGQPNRITGPRVTAILLNGWILPIEEGSAVEGLRSTGLPRLVSARALFFLVIIIQHYYDGTQVKF